MRVRGVKKEHNTARAATAKRCRQGLENVVFKRIYMCVCLYAKIYWFRL